MLILTAALGGVAAFAAAAIPPITQEANLAAATEPNLTAVVAVKWVPVTVTVVPPVVGPEFGEIAVTTGAAR